MRVLVLVEGPTERAIIDNVFAPFLSLKNVFLYPRVVGKPGHKGGNKFPVVKRELTALIKQEPDSVITMFFDYYALNDDWPGIRESKGKNTDNALEILKQSITNAILPELGANFNQARFIPYIQFYEVESLLFASPDDMAKVFCNPNLKSIFEKMVEDCRGCENINDNVNTAPSKRIMKVFPSYKKGRSVNAHAYRIAQHIGVEGIRQQCPKFNNWFTSLERLGAP
jgi:hypothetical protein